MSELQPATEGAGGTAAGPWRGVVATLLLIALCAPLVLAIEPLREAVGAALRGDSEVVRDELGSAGGALLVVGLTLVHTVVWYPAEIVDAAAGFVFGFWAGLALVHGGWIASGLLAYAIGRSAARPVLYRLAGERRFLAAEGLVRRGGVPLLLAIRLVPVLPFSLMGMVAGAARAHLLHYAWTTALGYLPITALFVYVGSRLEELSPADPVLWLGAAVLLALFLAWRYVSTALRGADTGREGQS